MLVYMNKLEPSKYSLAAAKRWANIPIEKRSKRMRKVALAGLKKKTPEEIRSRINLMVTAHKNKAKIRKLSNNEN